MIASRLDTAIRPTASFLGRVWVASVLALWLVLLGYSVQSLHPTGHEMRVSSAHSGAGVVSTDTGKRTSLTQSSRVAAPDSALKTSHSDDFHMEASICFSSESEPDKSPAFSNRCKQSLPIGRLHAGIPARQIRHSVWLATSSRGPPTLA